MSDLNKLQIIGRLGGDPESRNLEGGQVVTTFSVATALTWKNKQGEKQEKTEWHNVVIWGKLAEVAAKYLTKGKQVYLEGRIETVSWEKDGEKKYKTQMVADNLIMLGSKNDQPQQAQTNPEQQYQTAVQQANTPEPTEEEIDDLPF
jgi:single-strand DNA-binding protein